MIDYIDTVLTAFDIDIAIKFAQFFAYSFAAVLHISHLLRDAKKK